MVGVRNYTIKSEVGQLDVSVIYRIVDRRPVKARGLRDDVNMISSSVRRLCELGQF